MISTTIYVQNTLDETRRALMSMSALKAPSPNGFHPLFYQGSLEVTGLSLHSFVKGILEGGVIPSDAAEALLVIIPKEATPISM